MPTRRFREAIISAIVAALLVMGLCNGAAIVVANWFPRFDDNSYKPFSLSSELNLLWFLLFLGTVAAVFGFFSTLNRPR